MDYKMSVVANMASSFVFKLLIFPLSGGASSVQKYFPILYNYSGLFGVISYALVYLAASPVGCLLGF